MKLAKKWLPDQPRAQARGVMAPRSRSGLVRSAFTLIEMLVVIAIILMLAGMMVMVSPGVSTRQQAARGGTQLQAILAYSRNRAKMNLLPTGVQVSQGSVQLIQSGGDYAMGFATGNGNQIAIVGGNVSQPLVNPGDSFEIAGSGLPHLITGVGANSLTLASPLPGGPITQPVSYRIMRSPRQLYGEQPVQFPQDVGIDLQNSAAFQGGNAVPLPTTVLFAPSGVLTGPTSGFDLLCFVVRDMTQQNWTNGFPVIIAVYGKTGFITAQPVNINPQLGGGDPLYFAKNARSSGM